MVYPRKYRPNGARVSSRRQATEAALALYQQIFNPPQSRDKLYKSWPLKEEAAEAAKDHVPANADVLNQQQFTYREEGEEYE